MLPTNISTWIKKLHHKSNTIPHNTAFFSPPKPFHLIERRCLDFWVLSNLFSFDISIMIVWMNLYRIEMNGETKLQSPRWEWDWSRLWLMSNLGWEHVIIKAKWMWVNQIFIQDHTKCGPSQSTRFTVHGSIYWIRLFQPF